VIAARNMSFQVFDPTQGSYSPAQLLNQSSSIMLMSGASEEFNVHGSMQRVAPAGEQEAMKM